MLQRLGRVVLAVILTIIWGVLPVAAQAPAKPIIRAKVGEQTFAGVPGSYCWPDAASQLTCEIIENFDLTVNIPVKPGDSLAFVIDPIPEAGKLESIKAILLDDFDAKGEPKSFDLTALNATFTIPAELKPGKQRIQAEVVYVPDPNGDQSFVSTVFMLNIEGATAIAALPTPPAPGVEATPQATQAATQAATQDAIPPATQAATQEPAPVATQAATQDTPAQTPTPTVTETPAPTELPVTATPIPTVAPTLAPTVPPPTATPAAVAGNLTLPSPDQIVPPLTLSINGKDFQPIAIEGCQVNTTGARICVTSAVNTNAPIAEATTGSDGVYIFKGAQPTTVRLTTRASDGIKVLAETAAPANTAIVVTFPTAPGRYVMSVEVNYPGGRGTYFFRVSVK
jgi:hypothetical protein